MLRCLLWCFFLGISVQMLGQQQDSLPDNPSPQPGSTPSSQGASQNSQAKTPDSNSKSAKPAAPKLAPNLAPPRSDRVQVNDVGGDEGESSSKDTQVDLS